ncbi:MAG: tetratricopeptide repeat protein [Bacteroidales bacterium]|nr:tetratricopeptide repeat protein [Bacteroidales bacterium]
MSCFKIKCCFQLTVLLLLNLTVFGQHRIDSLYFILKSNPKNLTVLNDLSEALTQSAPIEADSLAQIALKLAKSQKKLQEEARAAVNIVNAAWVTRDFQKLLEHAELAAGLYEQLNEPLESARYLNDAALAAYEIDLYEVSLKNYRKALEILLELEDDENIPSVLVNIAQVYDMMGSYDSAIYFSNQAIGLSQIPGYESELGSAYSNLGLVYKKMGEFDKALENYKKAYDLSVTQSDSNMMAIDLNNIASLYSHWEKYMLARDYFEQALTIYQKSGKWDGVEIAMNNIANILQNEGKYDSALVMYHESLAIARKMGRTGSVAVKLSNIGTLFYELKNYDSAIVYQNEALEISQSIGRKDAVCKTLQNLGDIYLAKDELNLAGKYFDEAQLCAEELNAKTTLEKIFKSKSELQEKLGNPEKALEYHKMYVAVKDSVYTAESQEKLAEMEAIYENEKKQKEIELLMKDKELNRERIRKSQLMLYWIGSGLLILLAATGVITALFIQKVKSNRKLVEKNLELIKHQECDLVPQGNNSLSINEEEKSRLLKELTHLIRKEKVFTQKQLTLNDLADMLNTNTTYLSHIINTDFNLPFTDFLNQMRVQESQKLFVTGRHKTMTIEAIADMVGFHSRSNFNVQFKKFAGVTPSVFIKNLTSVSFQEN